VIAYGVWVGRSQASISLRGEDGFLVINGGLSYIVPDVLKQMEDVGIDEGRITKLLILHSHFDHVGIVPFLKRRHSTMPV
jgi:glyoxylase-like metal-dependent hydrolase (beta-lactamase superfamily II)